MATTKSLTDEQTSFLLSHITCNVELATYDGDDLNTYLECMDHYEVLIQFTQE